MTEAPTLTQLPAVATSGLDPDDRSVALTVRSACVLVVELAKADDVPASARTATTDTTSIRRVVKRDIDLSLVVTAVRAAC